MVRLKTALAFLMLVLLLVSFQNCGPGFQTLTLNDGTKTSIDDDPLPSTGKPLQCDPSLSGSADKGARKLSRLELIASLTALVGSSVMNEGSVSSSLGMISDQSDDVLALETVAGRIADVVIGNPALLNQVLGGCATSNISQCADSLVNKFAYKAFRRPLPDDVKSSIRALVTQIDGVDGLRAGIVRVLISPYFFLHLELGEDGNACDSNCPNLASGAVRMKLSPYEIASRLAFRLTGAPPDEALMLAAAQNQLATTAAIQAQGRRLLGLSAARENWRRVTVNWLGLSSVPDPTNATAGEAGITASGFGSEALDELLKYSVYEVFDKKGTYSDLLTDPVAFPSTDRLAKVYGVAKSANAATISQDRAGLLLKPALLISNNNFSRPIQRGVLVQRKILCNEIGNPNQNEINERTIAAALSHTNFSNREYTTRLNAPVACMNCHRSIDPVGYALEKFGPVGAPRTQETVYSDTGSVIATHAIDTSVHDLLLSEGLITSTQDAKGLATQIGKSYQAQQCLSRAMVTHTRLRTLNTADGCLINDLTEMQKNGSSLWDTLLQATANDEIFWKSAKELQ